MNILFLDIDGVLNSTRTVLATGGFPHTYEEKDRHRFDWTGVQLVRKLCQETNSQIVLSSTWRMHFTAEATAAFFDLPVIDCTPVFHGNRGTEINYWLSQHPEVVNYAIVDDNSDMLIEQKPHFVQTSMEDGITYNAFLALRRILEGRLGAYTENTYNQLFWGGQDADENA